MQVKREIRNRKGRGRLRIPYITPKEKLINNMKQLQEFLEEVSDDLTMVIEKVREQEGEFEERDRVRKEEEKERQEQARRNNRHTGLAFQNITSTPLRGESNRVQPSYTISTQNRQTNKGVFINPNTVRHSYAQATDSNSNDDFEHFSNDSMSHNTENGYGPQATETNGRASFANDHT